MDLELQRLVTTTRLSRRALLAGAAGSVVLSACGGSSGNGEALPAAETDGTFTLIQRFPPGVLTPGEIRMPFQLSRGSANPVADGPDTLRAVVVDIDGAQVGEPITAGKRSVEPIPYYDFRVRLDEAGIYALIVDGGPPEGANFQVIEASESPVPSAGMQLPGFATPTFDDPQGLATVCTRTPEPCPFHDISLDAALAAGRPVAYYVGTPEFCATGSCGPALEALIDLHADFADISFVHAEVYTDELGAEVAPAVRAIGMNYEPALFVTDAQGVIVERIDAIWGPDEVAEALTRVTA